MNLLKKTYLSAAMAAVLAGGGVPGYVGAVTLSQDNIGDVGIVPYYTMRDGWGTDFYIINTSSSTVAAKVRFHEARNSREVLDFIVVLSPHDMINAYAMIDGNGDPVLKFPPNNGENSCVVPIPDGGLPGGTLRFKADAINSPADGYPVFGQDPVEDAGLDRALEGYFTVIEMGSSTEGPVYDASLHPTPACDVIEDAFRPPEADGSTIYETYEEFERNLNALKVGFSLTNFARGTQGAGSATMLSNFATWDSWIAHTAISIGAAGGEVAALQVQLNTVLGPAQSDAYDAVDDAANVLELTPGCNYFSTNGRPSRYFDWPSAADVVDPAATPSGVKACGAIPQAIDAYGDAVYNYNVARAAYDAGEQAYEEAAAVQLGSPRNLISPQTTEQQATEGRAPDLNSGDFLAYWLVDGEYKDDQSNYDRRPGGINPPFGLWWGIYARPVDAVTALLMKSDAINEWAYNYYTGARSDLILTAPTKRFYTDFKTVYANEPHLMGISPVLGLAVANINFGFPPFSDQFSPSGRACDPIVVGVWNNDELGPTNNTISSPGTPKELCWETNVLYTGPESEGSLFGTKVGYNLNVRNIFPEGTSEEETYNGWVNVHMANEPWQYHPAIPLLNITLPNNFPGSFSEVVQVGMPYIGFAFKERSLGIPERAYSGLTPHSYLRLWDERNPFGGEWFTDLGSLNATAQPVAPVAP